ncbi:mannitol dehydrogenase family protein [Oharaeibacter diazotrophicus]|uniref:Fructuronate reductase n=1 Tax=Oharaeibacter diazotrophicus TaxID=1920512 RepID=A0A4R6RKR5_9HYPH|nr:fructuronate reductase [Oharaeibacter diazotrophicus]BBE70838.1 mannitol 2-dehydrogenase [Pleomorphomonas sp. SM30]GLS77587.1 mannitol dehydrogenase [Oharaeibacter diazotrophicus]
MTTDPTRLSLDRLADLPADVARPDYRRGRAPAVGIVHLGIGAFHRAHQAVFTDRVLAAGGGAWGICGVSLRSPDTRDALAPQDGLYTVATRSAEGETLRVVGSVVDLAVAPEAPEAVLRRMSDPRTRVVSLTVTEKGYCRLPASGDLDEDDPAVRRDLAAPGRPTTAIGFVVEALARRRAAGVAPFTLVSCDNLPANGKALRQVVRRFAELRNSALGAFVGEEVAFPSTMVDRIVPATTDADRAAVSARLGSLDAWPVVTEPFSQWVLEDDFRAGRPAWEDAGAVFVADVRPYEEMKLRLLNASHSALAYLGGLAGHETVADAMAAPGFAAFLEAAMAEELAPTLQPLPGIDLSAYRAALIARFRNPAVRHRLAQIATDGSQKLPQRILAPVRRRLADGLPFDRLALAIAAWMRAMAGRDDAGRPFVFADPLAERIRAAVGEATAPRAVLAAFLRIEAVFGTDLPASADFVETVGAALERLAAVGAATAVREGTAGRG